MRIKKTSLTYILLFVFWLTYYRPVVLERISPLLDNTVYVFHFFVLFVLVFYKLSPLINDLKNTKRRKISASYMFLIAFFLWNFICVVTMAPDHVREYVMEVVHVVEIVIVFRCVKMDRVKTNISVLGTVSYIYIWANFVSMILFKNGFFVSHIGSSSARVQWLLGSKNSIPVYVMVHMLGVQAKRDYEHRTVAYLTSVVGFVSVFFAGSKGLEFMGGSMAGIFACGTLIILFIYIDLNEKNVKSPFFLSTKLNVLLVVIANVIILGGVMIPFVNTFIVSVLHKTLDYTGRRVIWEYALTNIGKSPIWGHGASKFGLNIYYESYLAGSTFTTYVYNMLLRLWLRYGIVSVILYFMVLLKLEIGSDRVSNVMMAGVLAVCVFGLMNEVDFYNMFFPIVVIEEIAIQQHYMIIRDSMNNTLQIIPEKTISSPT